jgi:hypothetical protein
MAAITFPSSPVTDQVFTAAGSAWQWDGGAWRVVRDTNLNAQLGFSNINCGTATVDDTSFLGGEIVTQTSEAPPPAPAIPIDGIFYENNQIVTADYTITTDKNAMSAGPITIDTDVTVTVPSGSAWAIV